ncbi:MAG: hypothetical protein FWH03_05950 [Firmicutes bacterium]|nr:hypothetical protein [Bacillota bacterium]
MLNATENNILKAVRADDVRSFSALVGNKEKLLALSFGRFPLLSLIYLYRAKNIAKMYENLLVSITAYKKTNEPADAYKRFKSYVGTALRRYNSESTVTPAEMLALTRETAYLKQKFSLLAPNETMRGAVLTAYASRRKTAKIENGALKTAAERPTTFDNRIFGFIAALAACIILFASLLPVIYTQIGIGTESRPYIIKNGKQLQMIGEGNVHGPPVHYRLGADIILPDSFLPFHLTNAHLDGGGHTIFSSGTQPIFNTVRGQIANVKLVIRENLSITLTQDFDSTLTQDFAFLARVNLGVISAVTVTAQNAQLTVVEDGPLFVGAAGFVVYNRGLITNSLNNAEITLFSESNTQELLVGGIAVFNSGTIENTVNQAGLFAEIASLQDETSILIGGIAARNSGSIVRSASLGGLAAKSVAGHIYVGGIAAVNVGNGVIKNCGTPEITIRAETELQAVTFLGGITAWVINGEITQNFSAASFINTNSAENQLNITGGIASCAEVFYEPSDDLFYSYALIEDNYYVFRHNTHFGVAVLYFAYVDNLGQLRDELIPTSGDVYGENFVVTQGVDSVEALADTPVFWNIS